MLRIVSFSLLIILQVVTAEPPPPHCRGPPPGVTNPEKCCNLPHLFKEEDIKECGIELPSEDGTIARRGPPDCSKQICLLKKNNLMKEDDIDKDAAIEYVDKWAEANPDYKEVTEKAKEKCIKTDLPGPPHLCEPTKIMFCIKSIMFMECPKWEDTDDCKKIKDHIEECKTYFPKVVTAEPPPPHCRVPHPGVTNPEKCCILPHLFKEDDFKECGIELPSEDDASARRRSPDCSKQMCLLKIHNLMKDDDIDKDAAIEYVDKWAEANPDYKEMAEKAKEKCLKSYLPGPPQICEATKIMFCIKSIMFMECPKWEDTDNCKKVKEHIEECKVYF